MVDAAAMVQASVFPSTSIPGQLEIKELQTTVPPPPPWIPLTNSALINIRLRVEPLPQRFSKEEFRAGVLYEKQKCKGPIGSSPDHVCYISGFMKMLRDAINELKEIDESLQVGVSDTKRISPEITTPARVAELKRFGDTGLRAFDGYIATLQQIMGNLEGKDRQLNTKATVAQAEQQADEFRTGLGNFFETMALAADESANAHYDETISKLKTEARSIAPSLFQGCQTLARTIDASYEELTALLPVPGAPQARRRG